MAAPVYQSSSAAVSNNGTTSLTLSVPASTVDGDLLVTFISAYSNRTITPPAGWTEIASPGVSDGTVFLQLRAYRRIASSEPASYNWGLDLQKDLVAVCVRQDGHDAASPIDATATQVDSTNNTTASFGGVTAVASESLLLVCHATTIGAGATFTAPGGMTERQDVQSTNSPDASPIILEVSTETVSASGATGARDATISTNGRSLAFGITIAPATGGSGPSRRAWRYARAIAVLRLMKRI